MKFKYYLRGAGIGIIVSTVILSAASLFQDNMSDAEIIQRAMELGMVMEQGPGGTLADLPGHGNTQPDDGQAPEGEGSDGTGSSPDDSENPDGTGTDPSDGTGSPDNSENPDGTGTDPSDGAGGSEDAGDGGGGGTEPSDGAGSGNSDKTDSPDDTQKPGSGSGDTKPDKEDGGQKKDTEKEKTVVKVEGGDVSRAVSQKVFEAGLVDDAEEFNDFLGDHGYDNFLQPGEYHIKKGSSFQQIAEILTNK